MAKEKTARASTPKVTRYEEWRNSFWARVDKAALREAARAQEGHHLAAAWTTDPDRVIDALEAGLSREAAEAFVATLWAAAKEEYKTQHARRNQAKSDANSRVRDFVVAEWEKVKAPGLKAKFSRDMAALLKKEPLRSRFSEQRGAKAETIEKSWLRGL